MNNDVVIDQSSDGLVKMEDVQLQHLNIGPVVFGLLSILGRNI